MKPFPPVTLEFQGKEYEVPPERVWGLIGTIEDVISRGKLAVRMADQDPPETKIAEAYAKALRYAGADKVQPRDILRGATIEQAIQHGMALFEILSIPNQPDDVDVNTAEEDGEPGKAQEGK